MNLQALVGSAGTQLQEDLINGYAKVYVLLPIICAVVGVFIELNVGVYKNLLQGQVPEYATQCNDYVANPKLKTCMFIYLKGTNLKCYIVVKVPIDNAEDFGEGGFVKFAQNKTTQPYFFIYCFGRVISHFSGELAI